MKSVLNEIDLAELLERLKMLSADSQPLWGEMNSSKMLEHCTVSIKLALNEIEPEYDEEKLKIGKLVKEKVFESEVFSKNLPTSREFIECDSVDFNKSLNQFILYLKKYSEIKPETETGGKHPYFGLLSANEWGMLIWKHTNHHFRQFSI